MNYFRAYLRMRLQSARNALRAHRQGILRRLMFPAFFVFVSLILFACLYHAFKFFNSFELIGDFLTLRLLSLIFFIFFLFLILSSINSTVKWFLSGDDLPFLLTSPIPTSSLFFIRSAEAIIESSWAFLFFSIPVLMAYYAALFPFRPVFLLSILLLFPFALTAYAIAFLAVMLLARFLSPHIIRRTFSAMFLMLAVALVITFRAMEIEKLARPEAFAYLYDYMRYLAVPTHPLLPSHLLIRAAEFLAKGNNPDIVIDTGFFLSSAAGLTVLCYWVADRFYATSYANMRASSVKIGKDVLAYVFGFLPAKMRNVFLKELKNLKRDPKEWSQVLLIFALIFVYVYNFKSFPRDRAALPTIFLESLLSFLNMGLLTFVIAAMCVRFMYPSFSLEGKAFWLVLTSPVRVRDVYYRKLALYLPLTLVLSLTLTVLSNHYIASPPLLHYLSVGYTVVISFVAPVTTFHLGARYADLREEMTNPYGGAGGILTMLVILGYTLVTLGLLGWVSYPILVSQNAKVPVSVYTMTRFVVTCSMLLVITAIALCATSRKTAEILEQIEL